MKKNKMVYFENANRDTLYAIGYANMQEAESAMDSFLSNVGEEYGRNAVIAEEKDEDGELYWVAKVQVN
jgi:hypothetical protein